MCYLHRKLRQEKQYKKKRLACQTMLEKLEFGRNIFLVKRLNKKKIKNVNVQSSVYLMFSFRDSLSAYCDSIYTYSTLTHAPIFYFKHLEQTTTNFLVVFRLQPQWLFVTRWSYSWSRLACTCTDPNHHTSKIFSTRKFKTI